METENSQLIHENTAINLTFLLAHEFAPVQHAKANHQLDSLQLELMV